MPFPSVSYAEWRARVESELRGKDFDRSLHRLAPDGARLQPA